MVHWTGKGILEKNLEGKNVSLLLAGQFLSPAQCFHTSHVLVLLLKKHFWNCTLSFPQIKKVFTYIPTMENIFVWHDSSYKRIFVCTVSKKYAVFSFLRAKFLVPTQSLIKQDSLPTAQCCEKPFQGAALSPECPLLIFPGVLARVSVGLLYVSCSLLSTISEILSNRRWCVVLALALAGFGSGHLGKLSWSVWTDGLLCCWWNGWSHVLSPGNTVQWSPFIPASSSCGYKMNQTMDWASFFSPPRLVP